jgi:hypothetical protein
MSNSSSTFKDNPILKTKYSDLVSSTDPVAKQVVTSYTAIYNNAKIINDSKDITLMDSAAIAIDNEFSKIIKLVEPCASISNDNKCSTPICNYVSDMERLFVDFNILVASISGLNSDPIKQNYQFIPFLMTYRFSNVIINNPNNQNMFANGIQYNLCSDTVFKPSGLTPSLSDTYNALLKRMNKQELVVAARVETHTTNIFLLYILLPTVILIVLLLIYIQYKKRIELNELAMKAAKAALKK